MCESGELEKLYSRGMYTIVVPEDKQLSSSPILASNSSPHSVYNSDTSITIFVTSLTDSHRDACRASFDNGSESTIV